MSALDSVRPVASFARFVAVALVLTISLRVAIVAFRADGESPPAPTATAVFSGVPPAPVSGAAKSAAPVALGKPVRVRISVDAGPDGSDVYVDGAKLGKVPYLGDTSCRFGDTIVVEIAPKKGDRLKLERPCSGGMIKFQ